MGRSITRPMRPLAVPALLLACLEFWARTAGASSEAIAAPSAALRAFAQSLSDGSLLSTTAFTLLSAGLGLAIGSVAGILVGVTLGLSQRAARAGFVTIELLRPVPSVALIPLAMLVFGFGLQMETAVVAFATFWPMLVMTQAAVRQVHPRLLEVALVLEMAPVRRFTSIVLPAIVARLFVALRLGVAVALVVAVTVEISANPHGMGYAMSVAQQSLDPATMWAWLFWIAVVGFAVNELMSRLQGAVAFRMGETAR